MVLLKNELQVITCEFWKTFPTTYSEEYLSTNASVIYTSRYVIYLYSGK